MIRRIRAEDTPARDMARTNLTMMTRKDLKGAKDQGLAAVAAVMAAGEGASTPNETSPAGVTGQNAAIHLKAKRVMMRTGSKRRRKNP